MSVHGPITTIELWAAMTARIPLYRDDDIERQALLYSNNHLFILRGY